MKTNVSYESLVLHLVEVFENPLMLQDYNADGISYESFASWFDLAMAPLSRGAYYETFGAKVMNDAENEVKKTIRYKQENTEKSEYNKLAREAEIVGDALPEAGNYYFAYCSNMCAGGHYLNEIDCLVNGVNADYTHKELILVCDVITVDPATFSDLEKLPEFLENYISEKGEAVPCGSVSTDNHYNLLPGAGHEFLKVFAVVCGSRWFFVDTEGHSYAKYILLPCNYMEMYAPEIAAMKDEKAKAQQEEEEREAKEKEARRAEYVERCRRWWPLMRDVRPLKAALDAAPYGSRGSQERKENNKKNRELLNARRANILTMIHAVFPGLKVSITTNRGWGNDYTVTYIDGPTLEEFTNKLDLDLFRSAWDTFSGWDDSTGREHSEFTEFADFTMCGCDGDIETVREISDDKNDEALQKIFALLGVTDIKHQPSEEEAGDIARAFGLSSEIRDWLEGVNNLRAAAEIVARNLDYWAPVTTDTAAAEATAEDNTAAADEQDAAPADGLTLEDIPGGVAVTGNSRTTYKNKKAIKAHGAKWNKDAQQWQATDSDAVASLRAWFALRDAAAPAAEEDTTTATETAEATAEDTAAEATAAAVASLVATVADIIRTLQQCQEAEEQARQCEQLAAALSNLADIITTAAAYIAEEPTAAEDNTAAATVPGDSVAGHHEQQPAPFSPDNCARWSSRAASGDLSRVLGEICAALAALSPDMANTFNYFGMGFYSGDFNSNRAAHVRALAALVRGISSAGDSVASFVEGLAA